MEPEPEEEYCDLISQINFGAQYVVAYLLFIGCVIILSPLLLTKRICLDQIEARLSRITNTVFHALPFIFFPFFILHEMLHFIFMVVAFLHPQIKFAGWLKPTFHTKETFSVGMSINAPEKCERSTAVNVLMLCMFAAPILGFIPVAWAILNTTNLYLLAYLLFGSLWCIPSLGDRMEIYICINSLRARNGSECE